MSSRPAQKVAPFYEEWWFLVVVALVGLIFILLLVFILIIRGQSKKYAKKSDSGMIYLSVCLHQSFFVTVWLCLLILAVYLSSCLSVYLTVCLFINMSVCVSVCLAVCLHLSVVASISVYRFFLSTCLLAFM